MDVLPSPQMVAILGAHAAALSPQVEAWPLACAERGVLEQVLELARL
jgi:hypothetical protein